MTGEKQWPPPSAHRPTPRCGHTWPLTDPSDYEMAAALTHHCDLDEDEHSEGVHRCVCGSVCEVVS